MALCANFTGGRQLRVRATFPMDPLHVWRSFWQHRRLIIQLARRDVSLRYKGSLLGIVWSFAYPLLLLGVYTFVFKVIFKAGWEENGVARNYALMLFAGLIVYNFFSECLAGAATLVLNHPSYVKKVVFPLEILPWVTAGGALFHAGVSVLVLLVGLIYFLGGIPLTLPLLAVVFLPLILFTVGMVWLASALGVYLRDISQVISVTLVLLMFMSPILYPSSKIPESLRWMLYFNPLAPILDQARAVAVYGQMFDPWVWLATLVAGWLTAWLGLVWFQKTRPGFADVV